MCPSHAWLLLRLRSNSSSLYRYITTNREGVQSFGHPLQFTEQAKRKTPTLKIQSQAKLQCTAVTTKLIANTNGEAATVDTERGGDAIIGATCRQVDILHRLHIYIGANPAVEDTPLRIQKERGGEVGVGGQATIDPLGTKTCTSTNIKSITQGVTVRRGEVVVVGGCRAKASESWDQVPRLRSSVSADMQDSIF